MYAIIFLRLGDVWGSANIICMNFNRGCTLQYSDLVFASSFSACSIMMPDSIELNWLVRVIGVYFSTKTNSRKSIGVQYFAVVYDTHSRLILALQSFILFA